MCTMPSCVIYIRKVNGNQYDLEGQGSSLYKLTGGKLYATLTPKEMVHILDQEHTRG